MTGKNPVKGEGKEKGNEKSLVNLTGPKIVIIEKIDTIEIVTETGIRTGIEIEVVTRTVAVSVIGVGIVAVIMSGSETVIVTAIVIALERGKGRRREIVTGTMMLGKLTMTVGLLVIEIIMITWNQSMSETGMVKGSGTWNTLGLRMIQGGMSNLSLGIGVRKLTVTMGIMSTMIKVGDSMIIWMPRVTVTLMIDMLMMFVIVTIKWMKIITIMIMQHMTLVKGKGLGMLSANIGAQKGQSPEILNPNVLVHRPACCSMLVSSSINLKIVPWP